MCSHDGSGISVQFSSNSAFPLVIGRVLWPRKYIWTFRGMGEFSNIWVFGFFSQHFIVKRAGENNAIVGYIDLHGLCWLGTIYFFQGKLLKINYPQRNSLNTIFTKKVHPSTKMQLSTTVPEAETCSVSDVFLRDLTLDAPTFGMTWRWQDGGNNG